MHSKINNKQTGGAICWWNSHIVEPLSCCSSPCIVVWFRIEVIARTRTAIRFDEARQNILQENDRNIIMSYKVPSIEQTSDAAKHSFFSMAI